MFGLVVDEEPTEAAFWLEDRSFEHDASEWASGSAIGAEVGVERLSFSVAFIKVSSGWESTIRK
jgi:hypothetical protein